MNSVTRDRRDFLGGAKAFVSRGHGQAAPVPRSRQPPPREELINAFEFEEVARAQLPSAVYATIAGSDRAAFDRITFRPRLAIPMLDLDLSVELFGEKHFTPILVGPVAEQRRYHADGELATLRGATAAKATMLVTSQSRTSIRDLVAHANIPLWYSVYADSKPETQKHAQQAVASCCKVVCLTTSGGRVDWKAIEQIRQGLDVPIVIKGVMTPQDAKTAIEHGVHGIVVSDHGAAGAKTSPIEVLPAIADTVSGKAVVLVDGSFRRGTDILKALVLGAQGVLLARPVMWGLAAYGAEGVQSVIELLQSDLARHMGAVGASNLKSLTRNHIRIHRR